jgi:Protein of unknown function (DUF1203)
MPPSAMAAMVAGGTRLNGVISTARFDGAKRSAAWARNGYHHTMDTSVALDIRIVPLSAELTQRVRQTLTDDFGNHLAVWQCDSPAPCRSCLRLSRIGEPLIVFAHRPFDFVGPYAEVGPIFIHANPCEPYADVWRFPPDFAQRRLTMRGYNDRGTIQDADLSQPGDPEATLARLFADERVRFVHVRNPAWGCYDFAVRRAADRT